MQPQRQCKIHAKCEAPDDNRKGEAEGGRQNNIIETTTTIATLTVHKTSKKRSGTQN